MKVWANVHYVCGGCGTFMVPTADIKESGQLNHVTVTCTNMKCVNFDNTCFVPPMELTIVPKVTLQ